jgi:hypothetical protein
MHNKVKSIFSYRTSLGLAVWLIFCFSNLSFGQNKTFRAGASTTNITPPLGEGIVGNFGIPPPANHVHDELHTRTLVLDDGEKILAFVISDNVGINREVFDEAKKWIEEETKIPKEHILMAATHTHSSISAGGNGEKRRGWNVDQPLEDYQLFLARRMADGVRIALNNLEPAQIGWGAGNLPQHVHNRRWKLKEKVINPFGEMDQVQFNPGVNNPNKLEPAGPTDPEISFISVKSLEGKPIALLANYSLHYVGGVPKDHISADYFGVFADKIQELLQADRQYPPFVGIMTNGTSGDVNNINFHGPAEKHPPYAKMKIVANDAANEVFKAYQNIQFQNWVSLDAAQSELTLEVRKPSPEMMERAKKIRDQPDSVKPEHPLEKTYANRTIQIHEEWPDQIQTILQVFRIGDLGIAAIPFEVFTDIGLEIKDKSPFQKTFTIELANGSYGYLPTPEQHQLGGYETWLGTNRVEKEASRKIVAEILALFEQVK